MSRFKYLPGAGWFVAGVAVTLLLIPTTVGAVSAALTYTGIEGVTGGTKANVTKAGQLQTALAGASQLFNSASASVNQIGGNNEQVVLTAPAKSALIVETIHVNTNEDSTPGFSSHFYLFIGIGGSCANFLKYNGATWEQTVNPPGLGETDLPMSPGLVIPSGDSLCAGTEDIDVDITVSGYTVAASAVP
ncbi:MAG: hypothetical protein ACLPQS_08190 [Acidimicrobiales bacterium]